MGQESEGVFGQAEDGMRGCCLCRGLGDGYKRQVDGSKCISYFTIELKGAIPEPYAGKLDNWIFGCDVCQEVCPWNRHSEKTLEEAFKPKAGLLEMCQTEWMDLTEEVFNKTFKDSPVKRTGFEGLKRNIAFISRKN